MSFKKNLELEDISISSFKVHKSFTFTNADSGSGVYAIPIVKGADSNMYGYSIDTAASSSYVTGSIDSPKTRTYYHIPLYHTIK